LYKKDQTAENMGGKDLCGGKMKSFLFTGECTIHVNSPSVSSGKSLRIMIGICAYLIGFQEDPRHLS
jgi:hypothetical protein